MKLPAEMVKLAQHIIETKSAEFDPAMLEDHYRNALVRILRKNAGRALPRKRHQPDGCVKAQHCGKKPAAASKAASAKRRSPPAAGREARPGRPSAPSTAIGAPVVASLTRAGCSRQMICPTRLAASIASRP
jgi:DNA end-binding protein Ku